MFRVTWWGRIFSASALGFWLFCAVDLAQAQGIGEGQVLTGENEMSRSWDMQEIIVSLIQQFSKDQGRALDAVSKLAKMGRPVIVRVAEKLRKGETADVKYYAALTLSKIRHASAAEALLPILEDQKAEPRMRLLALQSATDLDEAIPRLVEIAKKDPDEEFRFQALSGLTLMPMAWGTCEKIFMDAFTEPSERFRALALNACMQSAVRKIVYPSAEPKLIEILKGEEGDAFRAKAAVTLGFMKSDLAVKELIEISAGKNITPILTKAALEALIRITGVPFRNAEAILPWWEKYGKARYAEAKPLPAPKIPPSLPSSKVPCVTSKTSGPTKIPPKMPADLLTKGSAKDDALEDGPEGPKKGLADEKDGRMAEAPRKPGGQSPSSQGPTSPSKLKPIPNSEPKMDPLAGAILDQ